MVAIIGMFGSHFVLFWLALVVIRKLSGCAASSDSGIDEVDYYNRRAVNRLKSLVENRQELDEVYSYLSWVTLSTLAALIGRYLLMFRSIPPPKYQLIFMLKIICYRYWYCFKWLQNCFLFPQGKREVASSFLLRNLDRRTMPFYRDLW